MLIPTLSALCVAMCVSVGFASWIVTGGSDALAVGNINADDVEVGGNVPQDLDVVTITSINSFSYAAGYGFDNEGVFGNTTELTGTCLFNSTNGKKCFTSFKNDKSFKLDIELSTALPNGFLTNNFSSDQISLSSTNFVVANQDPADADKITASFVITCTNNENNFNFDFSIRLIYGAQLSSFPNLSTANFNVKFTPKENEQ